jgi:hypothetical protein
LARLWLKSLRKQFFQPQSRPSRRTRPASRLLLEGLEARLAPAAVITTIAGNGNYGYGGDGGPATSAMLYLPIATAVDSSGNVFIADSYNSRIREVDRATGNITTFGGTDAVVARPNGVAVDASGNVYISDTYNDRIREVVKAAGNIITLAGTGLIGFTGDGGPATSAKINYPFGIAVDGSGNVFLADQGNNRIREIVKATGTIMTVAGTGTATYNGDNIPATSAALNQPNGIAVDASGNIFISDWHNSRIREVVKATGQIITVAGTGTPGFGGDNGPATSASLNYRWRGGGRERQPLHHRFQQRAHPQGRQGHRHHHDPRRHRHHGLRRRRRPGDSGHDESAVPAVGGQQRQRLLLRFQ